MMYSDAQATKYWQKYEKGKDHHNAAHLYSDTEKYHRFYIGDQWHGLKSAKEELPIFNFIKPVGKYKISMVAQNSMGIVYSDMRGENRQVVEELNTFAVRQWERSKMDTLAWKMIKRAFIAGTNYLYCFEKGGEFQHRLVNTTNIHLADEQNPDINAQEYVIIDERISVKAARETARAKGVPEENIVLIVSDESTETQIGERAELDVKGDEGKCNSILYMELTPEGLRFLRSTEKVIYQPEQTIAGLDIYPLVGMQWEEQPGSARGVSGVKHMIPNQLEVNKTAARRAIAVKRVAYPVLVYDGDKIGNPKKLSEAGASIEIKNMGQNRIDQMISYLNPASISGDAEKLQSEFINVTRDLEGAGDAATGQVDPTKASGEAIKAARDQAAVPLNEQIANYKQFVEDLALMWYKLWVAYDWQSIEVEQDGQQQLITPEQLHAMEIDIKVDVSPIDPFSKISQEIALERLFQSEAVTFEEYVQALDDSSTVPKAKLEEIIKQRQQLVLEQEQSELAQTREQLAQAVALLQQAGILQGGGGGNAMPVM